MFSCLVVSNCFLWYIHDMFYWVISALCLQGLQQVEEQSQPSAGWQPFSPTHCIKWQGHAPSCGTITDKISPDTLAVPSMSRHLSVHSAQGQGAEETWNRRKLQVLSAVVWEEVLGIKGEPKSSFHLDTATFLTVYQHDNLHVRLCWLRCCHFSATTSGPVHTPGVLEVSIKKGEYLAPTGSADWVQEKTDFCTFMAAGMSMRVAEPCSTSQTLARPWDYLNWVPK